MKIHIEKKEGKEKKGLFSSVNIHEIFCRYELNEEEQAIVDKHPDIKKMKGFDYNYQGLDLSPSVGRLIQKIEKAGDKGCRLVAYNSSELIDYENEINETAKKLKAHILSLQGSTGSSVTEI